MSKESLSKMVINRLSNDPCIRKMLDDDGKNYILEGDSDSEKIMRALTLTEVKIYSTIEISSFLRSNIVINN